MVQRGENVVDKAGAGEAPVTIKKYANRRLYNTATSSYVTLDNLAQMLKQGSDFVVFDAKTGEDITRSVLTQIIFEEEGKGQNMLPIRFLRQLIRFYGDNLQSVVPNYLDMSMEAFARNQEQMRSYITEAFGKTHPFRQFEELARQNMGMFERTVRMFSPFGAGGALNTLPPAAEAKPAAAAPEDEMAELRRQLAGMQKQLDELASKK
ncbi:polyhydroxyalkanoate synthesis repressor PhaR [Zavarzinia sp. CC-PAN008]|uniref:polyhydroxyalkanoate synthesis repressor PhaR n=1 Tax=Zavarzinia sp. CC-PAN008 TaxID=3243332 RepID=UPI003F74449C